ncbi:HAD hydrolase family protein [Candidatus Woesearchaeota archaeon]|nr:HAD hydrolase family protein [Candidatus Woesearchaeota archaeon]
MKMEEKIHLIKNKAAVDATILTKDRAIVKYANFHDIPLENLAAIGDGTTDLPMLTLEGIGLAGAPANSQARVKETVGSLPNGWVSSEEVFDAFIEFYNIARDSGLTNIISDRDGVLKWKNDMRGARDFRQILDYMGNNRNPFVTVLTGSGVTQNLEFMDIYGFNDPNLRSNKAIRDNPYILLAEGGLIHFDVIHGETINLCRKLNQDLLDKLKNDFEPEVADKIKSRVLDDFGLEWSSDYNDQEGKIYRPPKQGMVTFNIPRQVNNNDYRNTEESEMLRNKIIDIMAETAEEKNIHYEIL